MKQKIICTIALVYIALFTFGQKTPLISSVPADKIQIDELEEKASKVKKEFAGLNFTPFGTSALSNLLSNISVSSFLEKGVNGKIELKYTSEKWTTLGLTVDQKIGKNDKEAVPFDILDGISSGTTVEFNLQQMIWKPVLTKANFDHFDNAANSFASRTGQSRRGVTYNDIMNGGVVTETSHLKNIKLRQPVFFNIKAAFTKTSFVYTTDSFSLAETKEVYVTPKLSAFFGIPFSTRSFFSVGYSYSQVYNETDELTFSSPFGTSANSFSRTLAFGKPEKKTDSRLTMEWRTNFMSRNKSVSFGLGPSLAYAFSSKKLAAAVPVYFINGRDKDDKPTGLQGGIRLGYVTSTKKGEGSRFKEGFAAQLIVTAPFNIFGNL